MNLKKLIKNLEKRSVITRRPKPIYVFLLSIFSLILLLVVSQTSRGSIIEALLIKSLVILTIFTFIFAIIHLIVVKVLEN